MLHAAPPYDRQLPDPLVILNSIGEAVYDWDLLSDGLTWSPNAAKVLHCDDMEALTSGRAFHERMAVTSASTRRDAIYDSGRSDTGNGVSYQVRYALQMDCGGRPELVWIDDTGRWFAGSDGRPARAHGLVRVAPARGVSEQSDVDGRRDLDPLTACPTRAALLPVLETMLARTSGRKNPFGVLLIAIDGLSEMNRRLGYDAVDAFLASVAGALRTQIRSTDCLARYGGSRFALVLSGCDDTQIRGAAGRAIDLLMRNDLAGATAADVRIGGVLAPRHGRNVRSLLLNAEAALDEATSSERFRLFDPSFTAHAEASRTNDVAAALVAALNEGRVAIAFQPIVAARTGETVMSEALMRIVLPDGHVLEPPAFLSAAGDAELLRLLDARVFDLVVGHLRDTQRTISVNISGATLRHPDWPARVIAAMRLNPGVATRLVLEISEHVATQDFEASLSALDAVRSLGIRIAVDHFGAGHASVVALRRLRPNFLKIDGVFVQNVLRSPDDRFLVRALVTVAHETGAPVIAEWVENAGTAAVLAEWGVPYMQGTHFGTAELPLSLAAAHTTAA